MNCLFLLQETTNRATGSAAKLDLLMQTLISMFKNKGGSTIATNDVTLTHTSLTRRFSNEQTRHTRKKEDPRLTDFHRRPRSRR